MGYCPAIKDSCQHFSYNKCQMNHPRVGKSSGKHWCRSHTLTKEIKDLGAVSAISKGPKWES